MSESDFAPAEAWTTLAHDLRTPVAVIAGYAELLVARQDEITCRQAAEAILEASRRLSVLIDGLDGRLDGVAATATEAGGSTACGASGPLGPGGE